jgi:murein L,D-transpeptidase YafK
MKLAAPTVMAILCLSLAEAAAPVGAELPQIPPPKQARYRIAIHCSQKVLQLWDYAEMIREYPIDIGKGIPKKRGGDHLTPIGDYEISWMASRHSSKGHRIVDNRSWCTGNKFVEAESGPALEKLWTSSYGGDQATVISITYPNLKDRLMGYTGNCIHIHADRKLKDGALTKYYGCIHMFPKDAMELFEIVDVGTPVKILP